MLTRKRGGNLIYDRILICAKEKNMSIRELERSAGLSNGAISKWENSDPTANNLLKVARILEKPIEYFLETADTTA